MRPISTALSIVGLVATLAPASARAQQTGAGPIIDVQAGIKQGELEAFAAELNSILRFRQLGDANTLRRGQVSIGLEVATATLDSTSFPRFVGRFGVSERVDIGAWGGLNTRDDYGMAGADAKIVLFREGPSSPVTFSVRPSLTALIGPANLWAASTSVDLTASRAFGAFSPYVGVAATSSVAVERLNNLTLDPATAEGSVAYAGVSYRWKTLLLSGEVENGARVSYAFRIGTRF